LEHFLLGEDLGLEFGGGGGGVLVLGLELVQGFFLAAVVEGGEL